MARTLALAGATLPRDILAAGRGNETGHWEPTPIAHLDDEILQALGSRWDNPFRLQRDGSERAVFDRFSARAREHLREQYGDADLIVLKEPRISLLADFWRDVLAAEGFRCAAVVMVRDPREVAASLAVRDQIALCHGLLLWTAYMMSADRQTRAVPRLFCNYEQLLDEPERVLDRIVEATGASLAGRSPAAVDEIRAFVQPRLRHHWSTDIQTEEMAEVADLWSYYAGLAEPAADVQALTRNGEVALAQAGRWINALAPVISPILSAHHVRLQEVFGAWEADKQARAQLVAERASHLADQQAAVAKVEQLQREREVRLTALAARNREVEELRASIRALTDERDRLVDECQRGSEALALKSAEAAEYAARGAELEARIAAMATELQVHVAALEQARADIHEFSRWRDAQLEEARVALNRAAAATEGERLAFHAAMAEQTAARAVAERRAGALDEALRQAEAEAAGARERADRLAEDLTQLRRGPVARLLDAFGPKSSAQA